MTASLSNPFLDALGTRTGIRVEFYDPAGSHYGFPTFPYRHAPDGLATRRQLRAARLPPNGQPVIDTGDKESVADQAKFAQPALPVTEVNIVTVVNFVAPKTPERRTFQ